MDNKLFLQVLKLVLEVVSCNLGNLQTFPFLIWFAARSGSTTSVAPVY